MRLEPRQRRFVEEYLRDLNASAAAIRAGYSAKTARGQGWRLLTKAHIQAALTKAQSQRAERVEITVDQVLIELARLGFADLRRAFDENGNLKHPKDWDDATVAAISSVEVVTKNLGDGEVEYVHKIKLWDKGKALEQIGRHLGMFLDKLEVTDRTGENLLRDLSEEELVELLLQRRRTTRANDVDDRKLH